MSLFDEVMKFRTWAKVRLSSHGSANAFSHADAEWECDYPEWEAMYASVKKVLDRSDRPTETELSEIVYVLARDNEDERVLEMLTSRPETVFALCELASGESEARWQIAVALGKIGGVEASAWLQRFVDDPVEYVRRRASLALQEIER
jgi:hypothetical protein